MSNKTTDDQKGGWISCSERLPEKSGIYWCFFGKEKESAIQQRVMTYSAEHKEFNDYCVTHWMPRPAPPQPQPSTPQIDNDVWIEWGGGKQPIANDRELVIKFRDGTVMNETHSDCWVWSHGGDDDDIIAYRVIENDGGR